MAGGVADGARGGCFGGLDSGVRLVLVALGAVSVIVATLAFAAARFVSAVQRW